MEAEQINLGDVVFNFVLGKLYNKRWQGNEPVKYVMKVNNINQL